MSTEAMRLALAAFQYADSTDHELQRKAILALEQAIEQAAQPVAWMWEVVINDVESCHVTQCDPPEYATKRTPLYTAPPQRKQHVDTIDTSSERVDKTQKHRHGIKENT